jgi:hypothetical protein
MSKYEFDSIVEKINSILIQSPATIEQIVQQTENPDKTIMVIRWLMDNKQISQKNNMMKIGD